MEQTAIDSPITGAESVAAGREDRGRGHISRELTPVRDTTPGKILERLEALEAQHLEYVHSHQARLKARLGESEKSENEFKKESNQIKSDIYHLASAKNGVAGNGHQEN